METEPGSDVRGWREMVTGQQGTEVLGRADNDTQNQQQIFGYLLQQ